MQGDMDKFTAELKAKFEQELKAKMAAEKATMYDVRNNVTYNAETMKNKERQVQKPAQDDPFAARDPIIANRERMGMTEKEAKIASNIVNFHCKSMINALLGNPVEATIALTIEYETLLIEQVRALVASARLPAAASVA